MAAPFPCGAAPARRYTVPLTFCPQIVPLAVAVDGENVTVKFSGQLPEPVDAVTLMFPVMVMEPASVDVLMLPFSLNEPFTVKSVVLQLLKLAVKLKVAGLLVSSALPENEALPPTGQLPLPLTDVDAAALRGGTSANSGWPWEYDTRLNDAPTEDSTSEISV
jgi:hypothetical protein